MFMSISPTFQHEKIIYLRCQNKLQTTLETSSQAVKSEAMSKMKFYANTTDFQRKNGNFF